jgi:hypothetical protein
MFRISVLVFLFSFLLSTMWSTPQIVHGLYFGYTAVLSSDRQASTLPPQVAITPQIAATRAGNVYVIWAEASDVKVHNITVQFTASADNGMTFMYPRVLSNDRGSASLPQLAATESGNVYVVWVDTNRTSGDSDIVFRASTDGGKSFGSTKMLSRDIEGSTTPSSSSSLSSSPQLAATESGNVYVVWVDTNSTSADSDIVFRASTDGGKSFGSTKMLSRDIEGSTSSLLLSSSPQLAATENGSVYVVWVDSNSTSGDSDIVFRGSITSGEKFGRKTLSRDVQGSPPLLSSSPQLAATESGNVYVVWVDTNRTSGDSDIVFRGSITSGEKFGRKTLSRDVQGSPPLLSSSPRITSPSNGSVYVVWVDTNRTSGDSDIVFRASTDGGEKLNRKKLSTEIKISSVSPQLAAIQNGNAYVLWVKSNPEFNEVLDYGNIVGGVISLGEKTRVASYPQLAATENGDVFTVWIDRKNTTDSKTVHFKKASENFFDRDP